MKGLKGCPKLYIPSTLNANLILWQPQGIVAAVKKLDHDLNHGLYISLFNLFWSGICSRLNSTFLHSETSPFCIAQMAVLSSFFKVLKCIFITWNV